MEKPLTGEARDALVSGSENAMREHLAIARQPPRSEGTSFADAKPEDYRKTFLVPLQKTIDDWSTLLLTAVH